METLGRTCCLLLAALAIAAETYCQAQEKPATAAGPLTPPEALKQFRLAAGLRIELAAAEPQIQSPVAMAFDEDGRLWVVEMADYPNGPGKGEDGKPKKPSGRIRILEDRDGDGFFETASTWADHLLFANGLTLWQDGAIVTMAPKIVHMRDPGRSGKATKTDTLYLGFAEQNPQLRVSHPILGLDGWIYCANGLRGGKVVRAASGTHPVVDLSGMDFRFDPLAPGYYEAVTGPGQYGNTFDDWGRRFVCDNRHHLRHVVMDNRYLKRNPFLAAPAVLDDVSELEEGPLNSGGKVYPISKNWTTSTLHEGRFTAACGVFVHGGDLLPALRGHAFTCEPTGNLVHEEILTPRGASFKASPATKGVEFLASTDDWFRPVFLTQGPDGALYVVDMYRAVIEHPEFMPPELKNRPDLTRGKDMGRIWRIVPEKHATKTPRPNLSKSTSRELVKLLGHPNAWWRTTAQRLIMQRPGQPDGECIEELKQLIQAKPAQDNPGTDRVHAAWLLEKFAALDENLILGLLGDPRPRVRTHAVRLAEKRLTKSAKLPTALVRLAGDADAQVRFQVALSLGEWNDDRIVEPLARIALAGADDPWTRLAVASSAADRTGKLLASLLARPWDDRRPGALLHELAAVAGARQDVAEVCLIMDSIWPDHAHYSLPVLSGLGEGMARRGTTLDAFLGSLPPARQKAAENTRKALELAANLSCNPSISVAQRLDTIGLLAHIGWPTAKTPLAKLLDTDPDPKMRLAAVRSLAAHAQPEVAELLMKSWKTHTPALRREVTEAMFRQPARLQFLLDEIEAKRVKPGDVDSLRTRQLLNHKDVKIRARAKKLLADNWPADRKEVLARYREAVTIKGVAQRGRDIFKKNCATCHRVAGIGVDVGPDIADSRTRTVEALLVDILNPNQAIDNNYINYLVTTKGGKSLSGVIAAETAVSLTLRRAEGQTDTVLRQDIDSIESTGVSLMPEGLEKSISVAEMADLLLFLKNWRYLDGAVPQK